MNIVSLSSNTILDKPHLTYEFLESGNVNVLDKLSSKEAHCFQTDRTVKYVRIGNSEYIIHKNQYRNHKHLKSVIIPSSILKIEDYAFYGCKDLQFIKLNSSINDIGIYVFKNCTSLKEVKLPCHIEHLFGTFSGCSALKSAELCESIKNIDYCAFEKCTSLEQINIPAEITHIDPTAFKDCRSLSKIYCHSITEPINYSFNLGNNTIHGELHVPRGANEEDYKSWFNSLNNGLNGKWDLVADL